MTAELVNLSGKVIRITSGGSKRKRPRFLLVNTDRRIYRVRDYSIEQCKIGTVIHLRDIQKRMGGYWEALNLDYDPNNQNSRVQSNLSGMGGRPQKENGYVKRRYGLPRSANMDLPKEGRYNVILGIEALIETVVDTFHHNSVYGGDYTNTRPSSDNPVKTVLAGMVEGAYGNSSGGMKNSIRTYRTLDNVMNGIERTPAEPEFGDSIEVGNAKRTLGIHFGGTVTQAQLDRLMKYVANQRKL